ncbi:MAG: SEC-C metal-binding domain-containing protein [Bacteriovoracaceae bacterium]
MKILHPHQPNDLWIIHREEVSTTQDGVCDAYAILDADNGHCFGIEMSKDLPSSSKIIALIKTANAKANAIPKAIGILKSDPLTPVIEAICNGMKIPFQVFTKKEIAPFVSDFSNSFRSDFLGRGTPTPDQKEAEAFIPQTYDPCPCASGQKYKFCCQKIFKEITHAMVASQEGNLKAALTFMDEAEKKVDPLKTNFT